MAFQRKILTIDQSYENISSINEDDATRKGAPVLNKIIWMIKNWAVTSFAPKSHPHDVNDIRDIANVARQGGSGLGGYMRLINGTTLEWGWYQYENGKPVDGNGRPIIYFPLYFVANASPIVTIQPLDQISRLNQLYVPEVSNQYFKLEAGNTARISWIALGNTTQAL